MIGKDRIGKDRIGKDRIGLVFLSLGGLSPFQNLKINGNIYNQQQTEL